MLHRSLIDTASLGIIHMSNVWFIQVCGDFQVSGIVERQFRKRLKEQSAARRCSNSHLLKCPEMQVSKTVLWSRIGGVNKGMFHKEEPFKR